MPRDNGVMKPAYVDALTGPEESCNLSSGPCTDTMVLRRIEPIWVGFSVENGQILEVASMLGTRVFQHVSQGGALPPLRRWSGHDPSALP